MPETQKTRKKRVRTAPFPLPPEKLEQVRVERERRGEALPTTFTEDECHFVLHISQQITPFDYTGPRPEYDWQWYGSTFTLAECLSIIETRIHQCRFSVRAEYKGEAIGQGEYLKREYQGLTIETIETSGVMVGLLEPLIVQAEEERLREEEARRTVSCDYPGCDEQVLASTGMARLVQVQGDGQTSTLTFYGCEGAHREALKLASSLSIALTLAPRNRSSSVHSIELSPQREDEAIGRERNSQE